MVPMSSSVMPAENRINARLTAAIGCRCAWISRKSPVDRNIAACPLVAATPHDDSFKPGIEGFMGCDGLALHIINAQIAQAFE